MPKMKDIRAAQKAAAQAEKAGSQKLNGKKAKISPKKLSKEENLRRIHGAKGISPEERALKKALKKSATQLQHN